MTTSLQKDDWKFSGNFVDVDRVDIGSLETLVRAIPEERWTTQRPDTHLAEYLEPIVLVEDDTVDPLVDELGLAEVLRPALQALAARYGAGIPVLVSLVRLRAGTTIPRHRDGPASLPPAWAHRTHTAVVTNDGVEFEVGAERRHIAAGEIVELNNWREHEVHNRGDEHRIHLLIDWMPFAPAQRAS